MRLLHTAGAVRASFDEANLVSCAGLVPVMRLAETAGLQRIVAAKVRGLPPSVGANPAGKVATLVAGMLAGADSIDDLDVVRHGGMPALFAGVYAPSTLGSFLRCFTHGHALQLQSAAREFLVGLSGRTPVLAGADQLCFVDIDSMLRSMYGKRKQGMAFGHTKVGGYNVLLRGYNPLIATISTRRSAPVIAATRLRAGNAGSARGAASMVAQAIGTAKECGATGEIIVRADSAFYAKKVLRACRRGGARFSVTVRTDAKIRAAIAAIAEDAWVHIQYPQAIWDEDEQRWISDSQVAEVTYTAFEGTRYEITARLIVRRIPRRSRQINQDQGELFATWRYHALFTDSTFILVQAEAQHRDHAVIEQVNADLIDGPLAHLPSGDFAANAAWLTLAGIAHNLTRAAGGLAAPHYGVAPRRHHPPRTHQRRHPPGPPRPKGHPAPTPTLAMAARLEPPVHRRARPTRLTVHTRQTTAVRPTTPRTPDQPPESRPTDRDRRINPRQQPPPQPHIKTTTNMNQTGGSRLSAQAFSSGSSISGCARGARTRGRRTDRRPQRAEVEVEIARHWMLLGRSAPSNLGASDRANLTLLRAAQLAPRRTSGYQRAEFPDDFGTCGVEVGAAAPVKDPADEREQQPPTIRPRRLGRE